MFYVKNRKILISKRFLDFVYKKHRLLLKEWREQHQKFAINLFVYNINNKTKVDNMIQKSQQMRGLL